MDDDLPEESIEDKLPERPLECHECKKPIAVRYTEIVKGITTEFFCCADCPVLTRHLKGSLSETSSQEEGITSLACGDCGTTLELLRVGQPLGCSHCYVVFEDALIKELIASGKLPSKIHVNVGTKRLPIHSGKIPGQAQEMNPSLRLLALNEALNETLKREDYEQAAWLRDQIKALTEEKQQENKEKKS